MITRLYLWYLRQETSGVWGPLIVVGILLLFTIVFLSLTLTVE